MLRFWTAFESQASVRPQRGTVKSEVPLVTESSREIITVKKVCTSVADGVRSLNEARQELELSVRRAALSEFFGDYSSSRSQGKECMLDYDVISPASAGIIRTRGNPRYFNGESLGEVCIEGTFYLTNADVKKRQPRQLAEENACYVNEDESLNSLRNNYPGEIISKLVAPG
jgi:hypothetical protein